MAPSVETLARNSLWHTTPGLDETVQLCEEDAACSDSYLAEIEAVTTSSIEASALQVTQRRESRGEHVTVGEANPYENAQRPGTLRDRMRWQMRHHPAAQGADAADEVAGKEESPLEESQHSRTLLSFPKEGAVLLLLSLQNLITGSLALIQPLYFLFGWLQSDPFEDAFLTSLSLRYRTLSSLTLALTLTLMGGQRTHETENPLSTWVGVDL